EGGEDDDRLRVSRLLADFDEDVEGVGSGDDGAEKHDVEADDREVDAVWGEEEHDVALMNAEFGEGEGNGVDPELVEGKVVAGDGVDEGEPAMVGL
ncbi:hypothetical protein PIB30_074353, partial [Stylosanthes scabra]|nr:hypothetical protein [Stylosanthes scabra]